MQNFRAFLEGIAYGAGKAGLAQFTRAMAESWSSSGVNCNCIVPGFFETELSKPIFDNSTLAAKNAKQTCIGKNGRYEDLTGPFYSSASDYATGQVLCVGGGFSAK